MEKREKRHTPKGAYVLILAFPPAGQNWELAGIMLVMIIISIITQPPPSPTIMILKEMARNTNNNNNKNSIDKTNTT